MTRLEINVNDETASALREIADTNDISITEAVRRCVSVYAFFDKAVRDGTKIHLIPRNHPID